MGRTKRQPWKTREGSPRSFDFAVVGERQLDGRVKPGVHLWLRCAYVAPIITQRKRALRNLAHNVA